MLKTRIIPCLDVHAGRVVKGVNFVDLVDAGDPVEQARIYDAQGADELCFLDITASSDARETMYEVIEKVAATCFMPLTVGGGVRTLEDIRRLLLAGADKVSINTAAVHRPEFVAEAAEKFGSQCIMVAIDAKKSSEFGVQSSEKTELRTPNSGYSIYTHGGRNDTGLDAIEWTKRMVSLGAGEIMLNSMDHDGTKKGTNITLTRAIADAVPVPVIASGGIGELPHFTEAVTEGHASAVLAASVFHFGTYTIQQVKEYMQEHGVPVRV